ncbi:MAG: chemotaxis protein CheX [Desulfuromonadaceae bacterium]|nr:chemotaxis protein CheX [Desulfuromonadaceae bacterium]MDD5103991.1 chemotaxis protein CheX [Desulfuromonadaceae bacterium]
MSMKPATLAAIHMTEDELVASLIKDVQDVFINMVGVEDLMHLPIQIDITTHFKECLTAMVGLAGTYNGLVSVHVPWPLSIKFTSLMLGMEVTEIDDDVNDAMGEIANMIAGSFKQHLSKGGSDIQLSTPSVVNGTDYMVSSGGDLENITLKFATDDEWLMVALSIED